MRAQQANEKDGEHGVAGSEQHHQRPRIAGDEVGCRQHGDPCLAEGAESDVRPEARQVHSAKNVADAESTDQQRRQIHVQQLTGVQHVDPQQLRRVAGQQDQEQCGTEVVSPRHVQKRAAAAGGLPHAREVAVHDRCSLLSSAARCRTPAH